MALSPAQIRLIRKLGDFLHIALPVVGFLLAVYKKRDQDFRVLLKSTVITSVLTHVIKFFLNMTFLGERPDGGSFSFPSGHTSSAFSAAALISSSYPETKVISVGAYALACFTGYSRIAANRHHYRDVFAGAALGMLTSYHLSRSQSSDFGPNYAESNRTADSTFSLRAKV